MPPDRSPRPRKIITVSASSKKAGKSTVAAYLVEHLGAEYGLKVSTGTHAPSPVVTDPAIISLPGTDTGAMVAAGAEKVAWVNSPLSRLGRDIEQAMALFPAGGIVVVEGNSTLGYLHPDFAVFVMNVPFDDFKPSATGALSRADMAIVDMRYSLTDEAPRTIAGELVRRAPNARAVFFYDEAGLQEALADTVSLARSRGIR